MTEKMLTIVIPAYNEEENLPPLLERIHCAMTDHNISYSVVIVDDHSTDKTVEVAKTLSHTYPISILDKKKDAPRGKATSLLSGFAYAQTDLIAMIDADLQYPPEAIPKMLALIEKGADVVVANRSKRHTSVLRRVASNAFKNIFAKMLHGFEYDVQSGLKVFRKEIIERSKLHPGRWMFDMEFLLMAKHGGYVIKSMDITFDERFRGKAKINMLSASLEMAVSAINLKMKKPEQIPFLPSMVEKKGHGFHYKGHEYISHSNLPLEQTAFHRVSTRQIFVISGLLGMFIGAAILNWHLAITSLVAILTVVYFVDFLFNLFLIYRSFAKSPEVVITEKEIGKVPDNEWPMYSIFCPLYKEWKVLPQFVTAISRLEYPEDKLQVMLLLEEDDKETIHHARNMKLPKNFEIVVVPHSLPKTKPKASNYGLTRASGEYVVIYDAEDVPDPLQLKKAYLAFKNVDPKVICIQAKLNFYNPHQNLLTRLFTAEYSLWFDLVLTGLQSIHAPIPLGGTSNHFRLKDLIMLGGWDSFNVTEDCDLGMRLVKKGYRTAIIESTTNEEANSDMLNWFSQRSRWIKGYIQTYLVHMRDPGEFFKHWKEPHPITFQLVVGGKVLALFINPFMWALTFSYFAFRAIVGPAIESFYPGVVFYMAVFSLVFGNFLYMYYYMIGCAKREHYDLIKYAFIVPIYWLFMSVASWKALWQVFTNPHYWAKTKHGFHIGHKRAEKQAKSVVGQDLVDDTMTGPSLPVRRVVPSF